MRGPSLLRTLNAGLPIGAALMLASCAAPPSGGGAKPGVASVDGANVQLASFQNSAFPYHGLIPNYQETGKSRPFLDVDDNGRLGHSSPRGGLLWEDQTYNDRTVLLAAPQNFDPGKPGVIVVFFHGNGATLQRDVIARQQIVRQLADSGVNGVLVAPQLAVDAPDSSAGKFWSPGGFAAFLNEAGGKLGEFYPGRRAGGLAAVALDRPLWPVQELVRDLAAATTSRPNSADTGSPRRSLKLPVRFFPERSLTKRVGQSCRRSA